MSVKSKLARQAVKTTAKHTARGAASKASRKPFRSLTLVVLGAALGGLIGFKLGRSAGDDDQLDPIAQAPASPRVATNSTEHAPETGAVS